MSREFKDVLIALITLVGVLGAIGIISDGATVVRQLDLEIERARTERKRLEIELLVLEHASPADSDLPETRR